MCYCYVADCERNGKPNCTRVTLCSAGSVRLDKARRRRECNFPHTKLITKCNWKTLEPNRKNTATGKRVKYFMCHCSRRTWPNGAQRTSKTVRMHLHHLGCDHRSNWKKRHINCATASRIISLKINFIFVIHFRHYNDCVPVDFAHFPCDVPSHFPIDFLSFSEK